jgi:hypothetical protein
MRSPRELLVNKSTFYFPTYWHPVMTSSRNRRSPGLTADASFSGVRLHAVIPYFFRMFDSTGEHRSLP